MLSTEGSETSNSNGGLPAGGLHVEKPRRHCQARPSRCYGPRPSSPEACILNHDAGHESLSQFIISIVTNIAEEAVNNDD